MTARAVYLVVGACTGLGEASARALQERGAPVVTAGRSTGDVRVDRRSPRDAMRAGDELAKLGPFAGTFGDLFKPPSPLMPLT